MQKPAPILALLLACAAPLTAQITADINVSQAGGPLGTVTVELDHVAAPMAVANFIGLATGQLSWIDSATGVVKHNTPYYDGILFHRIIDGFMIQTGSQNGQGTDGPGYSFQDGVEVINGLDLVEPYVIAMANAGPSTNGSQFFITVSEQSRLNGIHIVFGKVSNTGNSRSIVDQINNLPTDSNDRPDDDVWIESITVNDNGVDFDPRAQGLPVVSSPTLASPPNPSTTTFEFTQPANSVFHLAHSDDLVNWTKTTERELTIDDTALTSFDLPAGATGGSQRFYSPALVTYDPDFHMPTSLANQTFVAQTNPTTQLRFEFDAAGTGATIKFGTTPIGAASLWGNYTQNRFSGNLHLFSNNLNPPYWEFDNLNLHTSSPAEVTGSHVLKTRHSPFNTATVSEIPGTFTLTK